MTAELVLWGHALAALPFGAAAIGVWRVGPVGWPRGRLAAALLLSALWALAVAGIGARDISATLTATARDLAWLWLAAGLRRRLGTDSAGVEALAIVVASVTLVAGLGAVVPHGRTDFGPHIVALVGSLILLQQLAAGADGRGDVRLAIAALGGMWGLDLAIAAAAAAVQGTLPASFAALRALAMPFVALLLAAAARHGDAGMPGMSRTAAWRMVAAGAVTIYAAGTIMVANWAARAFGEEGRAVQTAVVVGATAALLTLVSSPWMRAWARVKVAKHLFRHRYDYRVEWQRFTTTLATSAAEPLGVRVVRAVAALTDSPAGLLLAVGDDATAVAAGWNWDAPEVDGAALARHLAATGRVVAVDAVRTGAAPAEEVAALPPALRDDPQAWIIVPLVHGEALTGAIVLARPPVARSLDWEDLDLLRVVGRQAASYLAEDRAQRALGEAARFDEFNRRFAFLLHDIKNVASQMTLVARNAERHAENAEFRADMVATLREGAERMTALLARLDGQDGGRAEPLQPVDVGALASRVASARRVQHPIMVEAAVPSLALAQPARLEKVLCHLIQNAVESGPAEPIRLRVAAADAGVTIEVIDRGAGMTAAFVRDELFRPFASTKANGFGIGAYEARRLVRQMGGTLVVESRPGEGTRFQIALPAAPVLEAAA